MQDPITSRGQSELDPEFDKKFKPRGAYTFFIILIILGLIIWFGIYYIMLHRI